jgi:hypothetical protein
MSTDTHPAPQRPLRLGGVHEVAELLGIGKSALADRRRGLGFPKPLAELACGPVWDLDEIEDYKLAREWQPFGAPRPRRRRRTAPLPPPDPDLVAEIAARRNQTR